MRRLWVAVVAASLLLTAAWWVFLISPRNGRIADAQREYNAAVDTESRLRAQIQELQSIQDREVEYQAALGKLNDLIPDRPLLDQAIEQIYALAGDTGIDLQTLSPSLPTPTDDGSGLREIDISVQVQGEFFEILGFLFGLNDMQRLVRVDGVALSSSQDESGATVLGASIELRLFTTADLLPTLDTVGSTTTTTAPTPSSTSVPEASGGGS